MVASAVTAVSEDSSIECGGDQEIHVRVVGRRQFIGDALHTLADAVELGLSDGRRDSIDACVLVGVVAFATTPAGLFLLALVRLGRKACVAHGRSTIVDTNAIAVGNLPMERVVLAEADIDERFASLAGQITIFAITGHDLPPYVC